MIDLRLVRAAGEDEQRLFAWRNSPDGIATSGSHQPVAPNDHRSWWVSRIWTGMSDLHIVTVPIGFVRLDHHRGHPSAVSIFLEAAWRQRGIGAEVLRRATVGRGPLVAEVRRENMPSRALFEHAGFAAVDPTQDVVEYRRGG